MDSGPSSTDNKNQSESKKFSFQSDGEPPSPRRQTAEPTSPPASASSQGGPSTSPPSSCMPSQSYKLPSDTHTHGLDLPWVTRDISSAAQTAPSSPHALPQRVSELNLSAHPSRHPHSRKNQSRTACFVHSLLQNGRARSPGRSGSTDDLTRGSVLEVINKGPERRDRWNRGMTKKELSDMALGVRELSKRLGMSVWRGRLM